jgi:proline iminopeptidase
VSRRERQFKARTPDGDLVGSLREAPSTTEKALLLHGGPGMSDYLAPLADELDGLVTTARYQQRGLAPSTTAGDASVEQHVADAMSVLAALNWHKPIVIGHSWGGYLAMHVAAAHRDLIGALVIIDSLGAVDRGGQREFGPALRQNLSAKQSARLEELESLDDPTQDQIREHLAILWPNYFGDPANAPQMPYLEFAENGARTWESIQGHFRKGTLARKLPRVTVPTLVIHGERSPIPLVQGRRIADLIPNATLAVVDGAGHLPWLERPGFVREQVARLLLRT